MAGASSPKGIKYLVDFGPLAVFFVAYKLDGLMTATLALVVATVIALALAYAATRRIALMPLITAIVVVIFGGLTLWLQDKTFIKMKPTIVQGIFAIVLFGGLILKRPTLQYVMGEALKLTDTGWRQLTFRFALFFTFMAILNEIVWRNVSEDLWIDFKVFGIFGLTILFSLSQMPLMKRHMVETTEQA
ncbi:septation protein A [Dongia sp.]|jgi:intracellular septation protein|uniref:septation protein A n=1 Tax=Dongia sp. TaxID=1977262 RepID=UPI0035AE733B